MKNIIKFIWRYLIVIAMLISAIFLIPNLKIDSFSVKTNELDRALQDQLDNIHILKPTETNQIIDLQTDMKSASYYRLSFRGRAFKVDAPADVTGSSQLEIKLLGETKIDQTIGTASLSYGSDMTYKEFIFKSSDRFRDIEVKRLDSADSSWVRIGDVQVTSLECDRDSCLKSLQPTMVGLVNGYTVNQEMPSAKDTIFTLRQKQTYGQIFQATETNIGAIDLGLKIVGSGGLGSYQLLLYPASQAGDRFVIEKLPIAGYSFTVQDLESLLINKDIFHFPLAAKLKPGNYYFIGLSNQTVKFNRFNTLAMLGDDDTGSYISGRAQMIDSDQDYGDLFFRIKSASTTTDSGASILLNSKLEDLGGGSRLYEYQFSQTAADLLDISSESPSSAAYFDSVSRSVMSSAVNNNNLSFKFDTLEPFESAKVSYQLVDGYANTVGFYSVDNQNWQPIQSITTLGSAKAYSAVVTGNNYAQTIYLKFTYDPKQATSVFTLRNLKLSAKTIGK